MNTTGFSTRTIRVIGHMVTRNEADRYLVPAVKWLQAITDQVVIYDDRSTDDTYELVADLGATVRRRPEDVPSFIEHEGLFRGAAWQYLERAVHPTTNDWILSIDADEFLIGTHENIDVRQRLTDAVETAIRSGINAWNFKVPEVFDLRPNSDGRVVPYVRLDGLWGTIRGCRMVRWRPGAEFSSKPESCGSLPKTWMEARHEIEDLNIVHLGYAREEDRRAKFERYRAGRGHNLKHIHSILTNPTLQPWGGPPIPALL